LLLKFRDSLGLRIVPVHRAGSKKCCEKK
jgi:hypothetical protein